MMEHRADSRDVDRGAVLAQQSHCLSVDVSPGRAGLSTRSHRHPSLRDKRFECIGVYAGSHTKNRHHGPLARGAGKKCGSCCAAASFVHRS